MEKENDKRKKRGNYMFTNKDHPAKGIMSTALGCISVVSIIVAIYFSYQNGGEASHRFGAALFLTLIFSFVGLILGILSKMERDRYYLFSYIGIICNFLAICSISMILYAGAYGL